ncbi:group II trans-sialidase superfamily [Trypanosoma rangeli]|uniref:Group II trans-sialidase superfamily n=1 Tax=Trypanosoma rangeli TaxID=5698 RepID=A0A422N322_TRYRA|nr:group II trans-sialidase superfamily [Trypanosoma rangeli]RNE99882.1 group II trans-sialidase superfamily [Trypanosoma rangeli]|eukprot:RNE99882.1 group II trans-sialidase superfamily [Trypanosoma rangeli]
MLNMSRNMFLYSVLLLLCVLLVCFGSMAVYGEEGTKPKEMQMPQAIDLFVPNQTIVEAQGERQTRESFLFPSLASAGGVLVTLAEGHKLLHSPQKQTWVTYADVVAGYVDSAENWSSFVAEVRANKSKAYNIFHTTTQEEHNDYLRYAVRPTTIAKGNKVFLFVGGHHQRYDPSSKNWIKVSQGLDLLVGEATQDKVIQWGEPILLLSRIKPSADHNGLDQFVGGGGSGVVMEDGTLVSPLTVKRTGENDIVSMIIYSKDDGNSWTLPQGMLPGGCTDPLIVEWERGQLVMIAKCNSLSNVFESRDMGATWTETVRTLTRVQPMLLPDSSRTVERVGSLTTATIAGKKVMLCTQKGILPGEMVEATALYLWVTDSNRTFHVGPISMDTAEKWTSNNTLLYSKDALHLLQERVSTTTKGVSLAPLTEQLKTITSVLETWAKMDSFLSNSSVPTAGLVGFLSDASGDGSWNDAYRCLNATVRNATKVENGFKFTGSKSYAMWPVNMWKYRSVHSFVNYAFTLVATVKIHKVPNESIPLLGADLGRKQSTTFLGLSYTTEKRWRTVFNGITRIRHNSTWEPGKEYKVALMLQDNKGSVYVNGVRVGNTNKLPTLEARRHDISHFYFGGGKNSSVTVKNVFLYNRPLNAMKLKAVGQSDVSWKSAGDSSDASEQRPGNSSSASEQRPGNSSSAFEQRPGNSSSAFEERPGNSSSAFEERPDNSSSAFEQCAGNSSSGSEERAGDSATLADVSWLLLLPLGLWGFAVLC